MLPCNIRFLLVATATAGALTLPSAAQSLTGNVGSAGVTDGEQSTEARIGTNDDGDIGSRIHYDYAFTDWYRFRVIGSFSQPDGEDWDFSALTLENWFQWSEQAEDDTGFNGGIRLAYGFAEEGPDEAKVQLAITKDFSDGWEWRANLIGDVEAGDGSEGGVSVEARGMLSRAVDINALGTDRWRLGLEVFSEFGNSRDFPGFDEQAHQIGPVVKISWDNGVYLQTGVRAGVTDGADDTMAKLFIGREF